MRLRDRIAAAELARHDRALVVLHSDDYLLPAEYEAEAAPRERADLVHFA